MAIKIIGWTLAFLFSGCGVILLKQWWEKKKRKNEEKRNAERETRSIFREADRIIHEKKQRPQAPKVPITMQCDFDIPVRDDIDDIISYMEEVVELARQFKGQKTSSKLFTVVEADLVDGGLEIRKETDEDTGEIIVTERELIFRMNYTIK